LAVSEKFTFSQFILDQRRNGHPGWNLHRATIAKLAVGSFLSCPSLSAFLRVLVAKNAQREGAENELTIGSSTCFRQVPFASSRLCAKKIPNRRVRAMGGLRFCATASRTRDLSKGCASARPH